MFSCFYWLMFINGELILCSCFLIIFWFILCGFSLLVPHAGVCSWSLSKRIWGHASSFPWCKLQQKFHNWHRFQQASAWSTSSIEWNSVEWLTKYRLLSIFDKATACCIEPFIHEKLRPGSGNCLWVHTPFSWKVCDSDSLQALLETGEGKMRPSSFISVPG